MPDISKIGPTAVGNVSKVGPTAVGNINKVITGTWAQGGGGGPPPGGGTVSIGEYGNVQGASPSRLFQGQQGQFPKDFTIDLSSSDYAGASLTNGNTGHVFFRYETGTYWRQDPQLYQIDFDDGGWVKPGQSSGGTWGYQQWDTTYRTTNQAYNHSSGWSQVNAGTSPTGKWHRDTGGTPSSSTGVSLDYHIYHEHFQQVEIQLSRLPKKLPEIEFATNQLNKYKIDDFKLKNYDPHPAITAEMNV